MPTPTRSLTLSIAPIDVSTPVPGASQIGQRDFVSNVTPTSLSLARNYDSFYLNPDLEALLNTRGFSTKRPEIIGMFNYEAPLSAVVSGYGPTSEFLINPSGELYDMQCQLKQLRYANASAFFRSIVGLGGDGSGSFKIVETANTTRESVELAKSLAIQFEDNKETALSVLDYLASIYNAVTKFIDMQYLNREFNVFSEAETSSPADEMIFSGLPLMDPSLASSYLWNSDPMNLEYFVRIFAGDAITGGASRGMKSPDSYSKESTWIYGDSNSSRLVSGTWSMLTLLNIAMGGLKGLSSPYETAGRSSSSYDRINDFGTKLPGYLYFSTTIPLILPFDFTYEGSVGEHTLRVGGSIYGATSLNSVFSNTLKAPLYSTSTETRTGGLARLAYFIGLDTLQGAQLWKYNQASSNTKVAGVTVGSVKKGDYSFDLGEIIDQSMGRDTSSTLETILEDLPGGSNNFTRRLLTFNEDTDGGDDRAAIESFTSSNFLLAQGVENSRNGRSYYCDEVVTKEIAETAQRLTKLRAGFQESSINLSSISSLMFKRQLALQYNGQYFLKYGHDKDSRRYSIPGDIVTHLVKEIAESYKWADSRESSWKHSISGWDCIWYLIGAVAANDDVVFHKVVMLNLAWCEWQKDNIEANVLQDLADEIIDYVLDLSCDMIKDDYAEKDRGNGHWALFDNGVAAPDGDLSRSNIEDHSGGGGTSSSYTYYPSTNSGLQLEREDGRTSSIDDIMKKGSVTREDLKSKLKCSIFPNSNKNPLLAPIRSLRLFEHDLIDEPDRTGTSPDSRSYPYGFTARGFDFSSKVTGLCFLWREFISKSLSSGLYVQSVTTRSSGGGDSKHDYSISSTWFYALIALNKRALMSFINFADLYTGEDSSAVDKCDPYTLMFDLSGVGGPDTPMSDMSSFKAVDDFTEHNQNCGYYQTFTDLRSLYVSMMKDFQSREINFIQSLRFMGQAFDGLNDAATGLQQVIQDNNIDRGLYDKALEPVRSDPRYKNSALLSITRDQLALNRSLYDSFFIPNRQYSYLPASKAIMTNQSKNLSGFLKEPTMLDQPNNKRFIASIGIPSGMLESLRNRMMDSTGNLDYRHASIVEISIWKRDLLRESVVYRPKKYVFDTSRFLIYGRPVGTKSNSDYIDDAITSPRSQNYSEIVENCVFRKYTPSGNVYTRKGNAYGKRFYSESEGVDTEEIIFNHMRDYYLKLFMRLSTGIDTSEDIFPFLEGNVFFDSVDPPNQAFYEELAEMAKFMFVDIDSVETSLNYDRLLREIRRSLFMSSEKYRNRVLYPKIFERTFAILIDPSSFDLYTGDDFDPPVFKSSPEQQEGSPPSEATEIIGPDNSLYHQYYATIGLKPAFEEAESGRVMYDNDGGYLGNKEIVAVATSDFNLRDAVKPPAGNFTFKF